MKSSARRIVVIFVLTLFSLFVALPRTLSLQGKTLDLPEISFRLGSFSFYRDLNLKLGLDLAGGSHLVFEADTATLAQDDRKAALQAARDTIERRVNIFGVSETQVSTSKVGNSDRIIVELPGVKDTQGAIALIGKTAKLDFRQLKETAEATQSALLTLENTQSTGFTGADFKRARPAFDPTSGKPIISFETKPEAAKKFGEITTRLVGKPLVIFLDDIPISAPVVETPITSGTGQITGQFTSAQTQQLANLLNSGALPVPIKLIEQRTVEASLGAEAVHKSVIAGAVGLAMVGLFMILNYGRLGALAVIGLAIYAVVALALYKLIPIVLTLPGTAGFILSFGMAVDTNILVFERMKEELRASRGWRESMEAGFKRGWTSIRDANSATLIIAFIIFNPFNFSFLHTSGSVRGFAVTLAIGVFLSLFVSIFVTRTILRAFARKE